MKWLVGIFVLSLVAIGLPVALNHAPLFAPPGPLARLKVYLSRHRASLTPDHPWPSLRSPLWHDGSAPDPRALADAMRALGWEAVREDAGWVHAQVVTPWLHFRDDVRARMIPYRDGWSVEAISESRLGKADFGANEYHLRMLRESLR